MLLLILFLLNTNTKSLNNKNLKKTKELKLINIKDLYPNVGIVSSIKNFFKKLLKPITKIIDAIVGVAKKIWEGIKKVIKFINPLYLLELIGKAIGKLLLMALEPIKDILIGIAVFCLLLIILCMWSQLGSVFSCCKVYGCCSCCCKDVKDPDAPPDNKVLYKEIQRLETQNNQKTVESLKEELKPFIQKMEKEGYGYGFSKGYNNGYSAGML